MRLYEEVLNQILLDISDESEKIIANDNTLLDASEQEGSGYGVEYDKRDILYSGLLEEYIDVYQNKAKWNKWYKLVFFVLAMLAFCTIIGISLYALFLIASKEVGQASDIVVALSSLAGIISSIIVLPRIIAEHLFPTDEDKNMLGMVQSMQDNDSKIRAFCRNEEKKGDAL